MHPQKIKVTAQQRANALEAQNVMWPSVPPENVYPGLMHFRDIGGRGAPDCGTHACFGGWCAWWPEFKRQGVGVDHQGIPETKRKYGVLVAEELFGDVDLFRKLGNHPADAESLLEGVTDHQTVTNRLTWLIANSEVA